MTGADLGAAIDELQRTAERLRAGDIEAEEAAALVERCAELAASLGAALDRRAAGADDPGQERLL